MKLRKSFLSFSPAESDKAVPAHDAAAALGKILNESFDLMILDVNLPDGDGFELCKKIKAIQGYPGGVPDSVRSGSRRDDGL